MNRFSRPGSGWIEVVTGSMFSGKSEELIRRLRRAQIAKLKVQVFKPVIDNRFSEDHIVSQVYQVGYVLNGTLLRPARVVVTQWNG